MTTLKVTDGGRLNDGFTAEKNDCTVRAFAVAFNMPYYEAHKAFEGVGRKVGQGCKILTVEKLLKDRGVVLERGWRVTLSDFLAFHPIGTYYMIKRGHAFVVKDGVVFDMFKVGGNSKIQFYAKVA